MHGLFFCTEHRPASIRTVSEATEDSHLDPTETQPTAPHSDGPRGPHIRLRRQVIREGQRILKPLQPIHNLVRLHRPRRPYRGQGRAVGLLEVAGDGEADGGAAVDAGGVQRAPVPPNTTKHRYRVKD